MEIVKKYILVILIISFIKEFYSASFTHRSKFLLAKNEVTEQIKIINQQKVGPANCEPGYFSNDVSTCEICPEGTFASSTSSNGCRKCVPGTYSLKGATICISCPISTYSSITGASSCENTCPGGLIGSNAGATASDTCKSCEDGQYAKAGDTICSICDAGYYSLSGFSECKQCKAGYYSEKESSKCSVCPSGKYSLIDGATGCEKCESSLSSQTEAGSSSACNFRESVSFFF